MQAALERVLEHYMARFGESPEWIIRSPGRVNLIGDHTDYNDGFVLPMALDQATWLAASPMKGRQVEVFATGFGSATIDLNDLRRTGSWSDYVVGMLACLSTPAQGFRAVIESDIPIGAGLSSSASLELAIARVTTAMNSQPWDPAAAALDAQRAENEFVGVSTGVMDQMVIAHAVVGHATFIDCSILSTEHVRMPSNASVVVLDTGTRRRLTDSGYEDRRLACERAALLLGVPTLRHATVEQLATAALPGALFRRARHVITENARVLSAVAALNARDVERVGQLMNESHASLRDDFEVSSSALDRVSELARSHPACFGARMTGGGFAGCGVALVATEHVDEFVASVTRRYNAVSDTAGSLYPTNAAGGVTLEPKQW